MNRSSCVLGLSVAMCAIALMGSERDAAACGGCFTPPTQAASDITDERMLLSVSMTQTTLYDQIRYAGNPSSFAWVLPIHGTVDVGLSADVLFATVDALTSTRITGLQSPCPSCGKQGPSAASGGGGDAVTVTKQENVGPYATVQLHPTSTTDSAALETWLQQNGFAIPADVQTVIDQYVSEGFDFLAMKLLPNKGIQSMRPVRVTAKGASLSLPLRMAAVGTGATVGITIWVVGEGRYEPQNFPFFQIADKDLVWDFKASTSNYTTLRAQHAAALNGRGWELESSLTLSQQLVSNAILNGGNNYGSQAGAGPGASADADYLPVPASGGTAAQTAEQVRAADIATLFAGMTGPTVRVTRMRSDISHAAMNTDFVLTASADQSEISNLRTVSGGVNPPVCPPFDPNACYVPGQAASDPAASDGGGHEASGCATAARPFETSALSFGVTGAAALALVLRIVRARRREKPKS